VRVWALAARLAARLISAHRLLPALSYAADGTVVGTWRVAVSDDPAGRNALAALAAAMPPAGHAVARGEDSVWEPAALLAAFLDAVADHAGRRAGPPGRSGRPRARLLPWTARWVEALSDPDDPTVPLRDDADELVAGVSGWLAPLAESADGLVTYLRLHAPQTDDSAWQLSFAVRTAGGELVPARRVWQEATRDAERAARQDALLRGLGLGARLYPPVDRALRDAAPDGVELDVRAAWEFISEAAPALTDAGIVVELPDELDTRGLRLRLRVGVELEGQAGPETRGEVEPVADAPWERADIVAAEAAEPWVRLHGLMTDFRWEVALGDDGLSADDFDRLVAADAPLVRWRDRWVRVDPDVTGRLGCFAHGQGRSLAGSLTLAEAFALGLAGGEDTAALPGVDEDLGIVEVVAAGRVADLLGRVRAAAVTSPVPGTPAGFRGELRPYQRRGVAWLRGMRRLGFGAVLADDMGLGKTVQLIAHLLDAPEGSFLIVCPTSVVGNWERELARFAPGLPVTRQHGPDRADDLSSVRGIVLTTYGTLRRDVDTLAAVDWDVVTLDEAQHVKNPSTAGARAVRRLRSRQTVALTGTPLENRLGELWALLDATNPGLLGSRTRFARRFVTPIEKRRDRGAAQRLRRLVSPFVLRREKRDPAVIADLPDKIERTVACPLTPEQAGLYQAAVDRALSEDLTTLSRMQRRGRILALITELKQICNHPAQYLREDSAPLAGRSGKLAAAREIVSEVVRAGDRALVFTQYVSMGRLLVAQLSADLEAPVELLHGGVSATGRDRLVERFQDPDGQVPVLVVSLRAGGTGLNLTAANHVLHYDRWWNPAVEDQATDRAHRIGQTRSVEVHKLVTAGTVEERVADILESKRVLAEAVIGAGEAWITELRDDELRDLVALSGADIEELDDDDVEQDYADPERRLRAVEQAGSW
jgi:superfamily II DNA or RNA helicase